MINWNRISAGIIACVGFVLSGFLSEIAAQDKWYVDQSATGSGSGESWGNAFVTLQDALAAVDNGDEIWIAEGVYTPDTGAGQMAGDREAMFVVDKVISIYGGFSGTEQAIGERNLSEHTTILSGDLLGNDVAEDFPLGPSRQDNSRRIVFLTNIDGLDASEFTVLDGLTLDGKHWLDDGTNSPGGSSIGIVGRPAKLNNLTISNSYSNNGSGLFISVSGQGSELRNVSFVNNHAESKGGAIEIRGGGLNSGLLIIGCYFDSNIAGFVGGAIFGELFGGFFSTSIVNSEFRNNEAGRFGGAMLFDESIVTIWNSKFYENSARDGGGAIDFGGDDNTRSFYAVIGSLFYYNYTDGIGGGIYTTNHASQGVIVNTTFTSNTALVGGAALYVDNDDRPEEITHVVNTIVWDNESGTGIGDNFQIGRNPEAPDNVEVSYTILDGDLHPQVRTGPGVIGDDPLFSDPAGPDGVAGTGDDDFSLTAFSPAIDAGSSQWVPADSLDMDGDGNTDEPMPFDLAGAPRIQSGNGAPGTVDMGAYEFDGSVTGVEDDPGRVLPGLGRTVASYPLPAKNRVFIDLSGEFLAVGQYLSMSIYDISGRTVKGSMEYRYTNGIISIDTAELPVGLYWARIYNKTTTINLYSPILIGQ